MLPKACRFGKYAHLMREEFGIGCAWKARGLAQAFLASRNLAEKIRLYIKNHDWFDHGKRTAQSNVFLHMVYSNRLKKKEPTFSKEKEDIVLLVVWFGWKVIFCSRAHLSSG